MTRIIEGGIQGEKRMRKNLRLVSQGLAAHKQGCLAEPGTLLAILYIDWSLAIHKAIGRAESTSVKVTTNHSIGKPAPAGSGHGPSGHGHLPEALRSCLPAEGLRTSGRAPSRSPKENPPGQVQKQHTYKSATLCHENLPLQPYPIRYRSGI